MCRPCTSYSGKTDAVHVVIIFGILLQLPSAILVAKQHALVGCMFRKRQTRTICGRPKIIGTNTTPVSTSAQDIAIFKAEDALVISTFLVF